jgi:hypothetical protein
VSTKKTLIEEAEDVVRGEGMLIAILRVDVAKAAARKLTHRLLDLERARALRALADSPAAFAEAEAKLVKRAEAAARELEEAAGRTHLWDQTPKAEELLSAGRKLVIEAIAAKRAAQKAVEHKLTGEAKSLWDALYKDPAHRQVLDELGTADFENLIKHTETKGTGWTAIKGRLFELLADRTAAWADEIVEAGERAARAIAVLPQPDRWKFLYSREGLVAHAFKDARKAGMPAKLLESLPIEAAAKDLKFSEALERLLEYVDKSAWLTRDYGEWQVALPLLFGESKGLRNLRDLVKQFPKDVERAGLVYAEIGGKPTLIVLAPSISRPKLVALGPRELTKGQAQKIAAVGSQVKSVKLAVSNDGANAFSKRLEMLLKGKPKK